ncbi:MAG: hypothetical protein ACREV6_21305 [Clostridium sp.]
MSKDFNAALESTARSIINTKDPGLIESGWVQKYMQWETINI